jgi:hypothetical protein
MSMKVSNNTNKIRVHMDITVTAVDVNDAPVKFDQRGENIYVENYKFTKGDHVRVSYECNLFSGYMCLTVS